MGLVLEKFANVVIANEKYGFSFVRWMVDVEWLFVNFRCTKGRIFPFPLVLSHPPIYCEDFTITVKAPTRAFSYFHFC